MANTVAEVWFCPKTAKVMCPQTETKKTTAAPDMSAIRKRAIAVCAMDRQDTQRTFWMKRWNI